MRERLFPVFLSFLIVLAPTAIAHAQATASGTVLGAVTDSSQAVVAGAQVEVSNAATDEKRSTVTDGSGGYRFDLLSAGAYKLTVARPGFATAVQNIELLVSQTATANVTLVPGAATQTVEVTGANPLVDETNTSVSQEITPSEVEELPMVGRDVANLAYLAPGVKLADSYDPTKNRYAILSINGASGRNINVTVNGIDNKDSTVGGPVMQLPLEAVEEFQISTQRFSAENGRSEGAAINMITKRGSNKYHGSAFGYFRDTNLDTDEEDATGTGGQVAAHPDYTRQQFGGSIGGPVKKDSLFAFFALEREREHQQLDESPTSYAELVLAKNAGLAADPATVIPRPFYETRYNGRMDWTLSQTESAYISYSSQANNSLNDQSDGTMDLTEGNFTVNHLQLVSFTWNSVLSNTTVNQATAGFQYWNNSIGSNFNVPNVSFPSASFGTNDGVPQQSFQRKWQFKDDFSRAMGKHTLKAGVDYIWSPASGGDFGPPNYIGPVEYNFAADPSTILTDKADYPDGFSTPGAVVAMSESNGDSDVSIPTQEVGIYAQDDWKATRRLTLNLGLRWDKDVNLIADPEIQRSRTYKELVALNSPVASPYVSSVPHDDNLDFSPRVGFAYDLNGKGVHVLRGGFGLYLGTVYDNITLFPEQQANPTVYQVALNLSSPTDIVPGTGKTLGEWRFGVDPMPAIPAAATSLAPGSLGRLTDPHYRNPVAEEFNFGYTWAANQTTAVEAEYTHVLSLHENKTIDINSPVPVEGVFVRPLAAAFAASNPPQPNLPLILDQRSIGRTHYDGFNLSLRERMAPRFQAEANYTLSWAYGYDSGDPRLGNFPRLPNAPFASYEYGPSPNDERHHITLSGVANLPRGFELAPILQFGSARPYGLTNSSDTLDTGTPPFFPKAVVVPKSNPTDFFAFAGNNTGAQNCFYGLNNTPATCTISKFDPLRGDPFFQLDMRLAKNIRMRETMNLQLVAQAFNLTNRANYGNNFGNSIGSAATFGHPAGFINPSATTIPRSVWGEMGARFTF